MASGRSILRVVGGVIAGLVAGSVVIALVETAGHALFTGEALFGAVAVGYGLGALAGTVAATLIAGRRTAMAVPVVLAVLAGVNLFAFPHPAWFAPAALVTLTLGWFVGASLAARRAVHGV